jgi:acyl carrier protein
LSELTPLEAPPATEEAVFRTVREMLADVIGEDYVAEMDIDLDTAFYADLEIESIEFVALAERLQGTYGDRVDFPAWIATMEVDDIIAMTVGQLVSHIVRSLQDG